jgi:predicted Zn-dependent peptidase
LIKPINGLKTKTDNIEFTKFELSNGLKVILSEDYSIPSVALNICFHAGSKDEEPGKTGFAHLFEHLMYEGSAHIPNGEYERLTTFAGGENNAYTTEDKTNYFLLLPSNQLELGLWLESDRMIECAVNKHSLDTQKKVVIEEKKQNFDNRPYGSVSLEFAPRLFPGSGYGWDTIGNIDDIRNASLEDVKDFFKKFYIPNNAVLSLIGNFDSGEASDMIRHYFSEIEPGHAIERKNNGYQSPHKEIHDNIPDNIQFPGIFGAYRIPPENSKEFFAFELLSEILSSGDSSRFYKELVYEKQLVSEIGCWTDCKEFAGVLNIYAILLPGNSINKTENAIKKIIESVCKNGVNENELQKAKNRIETKNFFKRQYILTKADMLAHYETFYGNPELINTIISNYSTITAEDILDCSRKYLLPENNVTLIYLPK